MLIYANMDSFFILWQFAYIQYIVTSFIYEKTRYRVHHVSCEETYL